MDWWQTQPEAWAHATENPQPPEEVMPRYADWVDTLPGFKVFAGMLERDAKARVWAIPAPGGTNSGSHQHPAGGLQKQLRPYRRVCSSPIRKRQTLQRHVVFPPEKTLPEPVRI